MRGNISHLAGSLVVLAAVAGTAPSALAEPVTYQGRLTDASMPATGSYDMIFRIYDAPTGGTLLATAPALTVSALDGLIVATPDFPAVTFTGATVYLDISLRQSGALLYTRLGQRQAITPAPTSLRSFRSLNERWSPLSATNIATDAGVTGVLINDTAATFSDTVFMVTRTASGGALGGMYVNTTGSDGIPYYGWSANHTMLAEARAEGATGAFTLRGSTGEWLRVVGGRLGLGTTPGATERLRVAGDASVTGDVSSSAFVYATPQTRWLSIAPEDFHPAYTAQDGAFGSGNGQAYLDASVASGAITTGVYLPQGAQVTAFDAYVVDNSAAADLSISLSRRGNAANGYSSMAEVDSSGASSSVVTLTDTTITNATIDNSLFNYQVWVYCSDWQGYDLRLKAVRITYTVPGPD